MIPAMRPVGERNGRTVYRLLQPLVVSLDRDGNFMIKIRNGYETDLASTPETLTPLVPQWGEYSRAAIVHDYLVEDARRAGVSRAFADAVFFEVMRQDRVGWLKRWAMWAAVRFYGVVK